VRGEGHVTGDDYSGRVGLSHPLLVAVVSHSRCIFSIFEARSAIWRRSFLGRSTWA
jgi:hypothetical protein